MKPPGVVGLEVGEVILRDDDERDDNRRRGLQLQVNHLIPSSFRQEHWQRQLD
jgi:hypothetical protein